jgi:hypothetical protein
MTNRLTDKDLLGAFFGFTLFGVGVIGLIMGFWGLYVENRLIGAFLLVGGQVAALLGARFASMPAQPKRQPPVFGNYLFMLCFVTSIFILSFGLAGIFSDTLRSLFLLFLAFGSAAIAAWSVVRRSRPG